MKKNFIFVLLQLLSVFAYSQSTYKYTSANLNLRNAPNLDSKILTVIPTGTRVEMAEDCTCSWIKVYYNGNVGYVSSKYLYKPTANNYSNTNSHSNNSSSSVKYYTNSEKVKVQSPTYYNSQPTGATALCRDGTYSFSRNRRGTCSHHGGVAKWLY